MMLVPPGKQKDFTLTMYLRSLSVMLKTEEQSQPVSCTGPIPKLKVSVNTFTHRNIRLRFKYTGILRYTHVINNSAAILNQWRRIYWWASVPHPVGLRSLGRMTKKLHNNHSYI